MAVTETSPDLIDVLHNAAGYIPKRAIRYFLDPENREVAVPEILEEMEEILAGPAPFVEEGSEFLFYGLMILAQLEEEEAVRLIPKIGALPGAMIEDLLGNRLFDCISLALATLYKNRVEELKQLIESPETNDFIASSALHAMMLLYGQEKLSRDEIVSYFLRLLEDRKQKRIFFYDLLASFSMTLHPEEMIATLRAAYKEGFIDPAEVKLEEIEELLKIPKDQMVLEGRALLYQTLDDLVEHMDSLEGFSFLYERNDPCPCESGLKYKKCCR